MHRRLRPSCPRECPPRACAPQQFGPPNAHQDSEHQRQQDHPCHLKSQLRHLVERDAHPQQRHAHAQHRTAAELDAGFRLRVAVNEVERQADQQCVQQFRATAIFGQKGRCQGNDAADEHARRQHARTGQPAQRMPGGAGWVWKRPSLGPSPQPWARFLSDITTASATSRPCNSARRRATSRRAPGRRTPSSRSISVSKTSTRSR